MKPTGSTRKAWHPFLWVLVLLAAILSALFWRSFVPGFVQFSNDAPLGQLHPDWLKLPSGIFGAWDDLNDIGANEGAFPPSVVTLLRWFLGPVAYSKFFIPIALLILGLGAWTFFRQFKLAPPAAVLGALAATLTSTFFSDACWGVAGHEIAFGFDFLALALIVSNSPGTPGWIRWTRLALAGLAVGVNVMEAADIGAIFSVFIAAFALFHSCTQEGALPVKVARGFGRVAFIALFAVFIATQTLVSLVGVAVHGIVGMGQSEQAKLQHWDYATTWSLPKAESLGMIVPGLFGYRMDTLNGGEYWGAVGRDPSWDRYLAGKQSTPPHGGLRFSGAGFYAGVPVVLVALWAILQSLRRRNSVFSETHRRFLWFWTALLVGSLPLAWGRFAPFYSIPYYHLPYFSTIRNPIKFLFIFSWALVTIFAYGVHGLSRRYLEAPATNSASPTAQIKSWWAKVRGFDRNWTWLCGIGLAAGLLAWLIYALQKPALVALLKTVGFNNDALAGEIAGFSIRQVGWFILFYALAAGLMTLILSGVFAGRRARWGAVLLGAVLVADLGRADLPWIVPLNYLQKNDVDPSNPANSTNPVLNFLRHKAYEHRVVGLPAAQQFALFNDMYRIEWAQHHFPYYNIQSLDKIQMSRMPADLATYEEAVTQSIVRWWELTNTRYVLAPAVYLNALNEQLDPARHRFRIALHFDIMPKPGVTTEDINDDMQRGVIPGPKLTAVTNSTGKYAVIEFTGALPRAKLYSHWETNTPAELRAFTTNGLSARDLDILSNAGTNGFLTLKKLISPAFDPWKTVLLDQPLPPQDKAAATTNQNPGTVTFKSYAPKDIVLEARATAPAVLLLNDRYDPHWRVRVDGKPATLLRCNFIMRGVYLTPGAHTVEFQFNLPNKPLYVSLSAIGIGVVLLGVLIVSTRRKPAAVTPPK